MIISDAHDPIKVLIYFHSINSTVMNISILHDKKMIS